MSSNVKVFIPNFVKNWSADNKTFKECHAGRVTNTDRERGDPIRLNDGL